MNCSEAETALLESLDQPLTAPDRAALDHHLAGCAPCREFAATQRALDRSLRLRLQTATLDATFNARILARVAMPPATSVAETRAAQLRRLHSEHEALLERIRHRTHLALRRGLLDGVAFAAVGVGTLIAMRAFWPRLEAGLATLGLPAGVPPALALTCLLALALSLAAAGAARYRISGASLWAP